MRAAAWTVRSSAKARRCARSGTRSRGRRTRTEPLLLTGPPGAGKEAVAHAVHGASRAHGAFIFVSCPELQTPSRPAPADATRASTARGASPGKQVELAAGGTLFLDAVHELPPELHARCRRCSSGQERARAATSAGASMCASIASTTRDLTRDAQSGRLDALLRTSRHRIAVPALADRREDIPALVEHFVRRHARQLGKAVDGVSPESMRRLEAYAGPETSGSCAPCSSARSSWRRARVLEIDEELLDEGLAVGSYRLVSPLGSGGMGEVWLAKHRLLARPAAVKLIRHDVQAGRDARAARPPFPARSAGHRRAAVAAHRAALRLRRQRQRQLLLRHGAARRARPPSHRESLRSAARRAGDHAAAPGVPVARRGARARARAPRHQAGQPLRGPARVRVRLPEGARLRDRQGSTRAGGDDLVGPEIVQGTPAFMAPEMVLGDASTAGPISIRWRAAPTGRSRASLFQASTPAQMLLHHAQTRPVPPSQVSELPIPGELEEVLMQCLEKDPAKRPASALELEAPLARVRIDEPGRRRTRANGGRRTPRRR